MQQRIARNCVCCGSDRLEKSPAILMPFVAHRVFGWEPVEIDDSWGLRTIRNGHAYSICNTLHCLECGLLFLDIRFTEDEMKALYSDYRGEAYTTLRERYEPGYRARNDDLNAGIRYLPQVEAFLSPFLPERIRVLDWGGDTGTNTPFKERAELFHVYDISAKSAVPGATIVDMETVRRTAYDLIVCSNVLEHVPYPGDLLAEIRTCMRAGTILYIEVPHEDVVRLHEGDARRATRKRHWHEHINFYNKTSIVKILSDSGFYILSIEEIGPYLADYIPYQFVVCCVIKI